MLLLPPYVSQPWSPGYTVSDLQARASCRLRRQKKRPDEEKSPDGKNSEIGENLLDFPVARIRMRVFSTRL
jgi:hypothetical protein